MSQDPTPTDRPASTLTPTGANPHVLARESSKPAGDWIGAALALLGIGLSVTYLANPTIGVFEFIPDNLPIVGNLDEVTATALLIACLSRFGIHLAPNLGRREQASKNIESGSK